MGAGVCGVCTVAGPTGPLALPDSIYSEGARAGGNPTADAQSPLERSELGLVVPGWELQSLGSSSQALPFKLPGMLLLDPSLLPF